MEKLPLAILIVLGIVLLAALYALAARKFAKAYADSFGLTPKKLAYRACWGLFYFGVFLLIFQVPFVPLALEMIATFALLLLWHGEQEEKFLAEERQAKVSAS